MPVETRRKRRQSMLEGGEENENTKLSSPVPKKTPKKKSTRSNRDSVEPESSQSSSDQVEDVQKPIERNAEAVFELIKDVDLKTIPFEKLIEENAPNVPKLNEIKEVNGQEIEGKMLKQEENIESLEILARSEEKIQTSIERKDENVEKGANTMLEHRLNVEEHVWTEKKTQGENLEKMPTNLDGKKLVVKHSEKPIMKVDTYEEEDDEPVWSLKKAQQEKPSRSCPYLDTIDRGVLDFDFEKLCSISLSHLNAYACLVCGKYFQGRGTNTHAYIHSLESAHRIYLNLLTLKFYCLPDNYEVVDPSLEDIKYVLKPTYLPEHIKNIDNIVRLARAFDGSTYHPGVIGLNNIKANDYCNVILHALSHVPPLRNYFLREENYAAIKRPPGDKLALLPRRFGELIRKLWNPRAFKAHVSPHEMLQAVVLCSEKRFQITRQGDAADILSWLLNTLHTALNGSNKSSSSVLYRIFRGRMRSFTRKVLPADASEEARATLIDTDEFKETVKEIPFFYLTLDLPPAPLYRDELMQNIIPQVPLSTLLDKFNGETEKEYKTYIENYMKRFELIRLPEYLIVTFKRFQKNQWFVEKNPTIVNFPITNVDLFDCLADDAKSVHQYTTYDLVSNIVHDGKFDNGSYRIQLIHIGTDKWYELEDLHVKEILPQMITLAESYIQIEYHQNS